MAAAPAAAAAAAPFDFATCESFIHLGRGPGKGIHGFSHIQRDMSIPWETVSRACGRVFNVMLEDGRLLERDAIVVYSHRGNRVVPVVVRHREGKRVDCPPEVLRTLYVKGMSAPRGSADPTFVVTAAVRPGSRRPSMRIHDQLPPIRALTVAEARQKVAALEWAPAVSLRTSPYCPS
jgi:hypothetical protein